MVSFFKTFLRTGLFSGLFMAIFFSLIYGWKIGVGSGMLTGILGGLMMALFVQYQSKNFTQNRPSHSDEKLIKEGPANHFLNGEGVGGWIYLTEARLLFVSHKINLQNHELTIPNNEILSVKGSRSLGIFPNKLVLFLKNGQTEKFVVNELKSWIKTLKERI